jgi:hypothetical protein
MEGIKVLFHLEVIRTSVIPNSSHSGCLLGVFFYSHLLPLNRELGWITGIPVHIC